MNPLPFDETAPLEPSQMFEPMCERVQLLLRLVTPLAHADASTGDGSNQKLFNRRLVRLDEAAVTRSQHPEAAPEEAAPDFSAFLAAFRAPSELAPILDGLSWPEIALVALLKTFGDAHNSADGVGLFSGAARWNRVETRLRQSAIRLRNKPLSQPLRALWDGVCAGMGTPLESDAHGAALLALWALPRTVQAGAIEAVLQGDGYRSSVGLARLWHGETKLASEKYAAKAGQERVTLVALSGERPAVPVAHRAPIAEVPHVSENALRHICLRAPGMKHLFSRLGLERAFPGQGQITPGAQAIFENGGNIAKGAAPTGNPHVLAWELRRAYPLLDLLGGCTRAFDIGESCVRVNGHLVGRENRAALQDTLAQNTAQIDESLFDFLDSETQVRNADAFGNGQMIQGFETLAAGALLHIEFTLTPKANDLVRGAFIAALRGWLDDCPVFGGIKRAGFGRVEPVEIKWPDSWNVGYLQRGYESSIETRREELRAGLIDGTLTTGTTVC